MSDEEEIGSLDLVKKLGKNIQEKSSSGSSTVYIDLDNDTVFQIFKSPKVADRIATIMLKIGQLGNVSYRILLQKGFGKNKTILLDNEITFNPFSYISPFLYYAYNDLIAWKKIVPLNESQRTLSVNFLVDNYYKIWYDISKALLVLKKINIIHNDTVLDNIGIYKGNFVLFDFDGSGTPEDKGKDFSYDFDTLRNSFKFRDVNVQDSDKITGINSLIQFVSEKEKISFSEAFVLLETLEIRA